MYNMTDFCVFRFNVKFLIKIHY